MCIEYAQLFGTTNGMNLKVITKIRNYLEKHTDTIIPNNMPFVGKDFNTTRAGIHADGLMKDEEIYNNIADFIIFQSSYSKSQCFSMFGRKDLDDYAVIVNGADKSIFSPKKDVLEFNEFKLLTIGSFRKLGMIEPVVKALDLLKKKFKFSLTIIGPIVNSEIKEFLCRDYIVHLGLKNLKEIAKSLSNSHLLIHSQLNDNCPNIVIEAISSGLPVAGFDSGAMSELLFFNRDLLAYVSDDLFQRYEDFDHRKLAEKIMLAVDNYSYYRENALANSHLYAFEECGQKYMEVFKRFI